MKNSEITLDTIMYWYSSQYCAIRKGRIISICEELIVENANIRIVVISESPPYDSYYFYGYRDSVDLYSDKNSSSICSTSIDIIRDYITFKLSNCIKNSEIFNHKNAKFS